MKVQLSVIERLICLNILPAEDNYATLKVIRNTKETLGFNEDELKVLNIQTFTGEDGKSRTKWENNAVPEKEFELGEKATDLIAERLTQINKDKKLTMDHVSLYDKFVGERA